jgi:ectoine utilization protein EutC
MPEIVLLSEAELRRIVPLDADAVACVEQAFIALAGGEVRMPPIMRLDIPENHGEVDVKTAYVPGVESFAIKISPGFFDNPKLGLPSVNGLMVLFSARTGLVEAVLLDNGYLTDVRTAAAGALAAKYLARKDAQVAAVMGAGVQARLQLEALTFVREISQARIWARRPEQAEAAARELKEKLGIDVRAVPEPHVAVDGADIVVTTTPATSPILRSAWVRRGQHITAMGSDAEHKNELDPQIIARADLYVCDSLRQVQRLGELHHAIAAGVASESQSFPTLGAIAAGAHSARLSPQGITVCDLTGTGVQDTAIASLAFSRAKAAGAGTVFQS